LVTMHADICFDANAECPRWLRFLDEVFNANRSMIDFVGRAVGYAITGDTREQAVFVCHGAGSNGKSVFLKTLRHVLGPYALDTPFSTFELAARATIPSDVAALTGKRLVTASETTEGTRLNEARVKALTGGDCITARFLHREFFTFQPQCKIWLSVNHKPRVADDTFAFWRRVRLIPFVRQFKPAEAAESRDLVADPLLADELREESPGILAWAVRQTVSWLKHGLQTPEAVKTATAEYEAESDPLTGFLEECCELGAAYRTPSGELYRAYRDWCEHQGFKEREILSSTAFGRRVGERFHRERTGRSRGYCGLRVRDGCDAL
jgi:putative DNA primase/helicase